jgi:hypothetical protein
MIIRDSRSVVSGVAADPDQAANEVAAALDQLLCAIRQLRYSLLAMASPLRRALTWLRLQPLSNVGSPFFLPPT